MQLETKQRVVTQTATFSKRIANEVPEACVADACGKAIIVGEHAVVYGAKAVAMPLVNHRLRVICEPVLTVREKPQHRIFMDGRELSSKVSGVIDDACAQLGIAGFGTVFRGKPCLPIGAGMGSSATLCIATLRALSQCLGKTLTAEQLADLGCQLERRFHGNPSGLDTTVVAHERVVLFSKKTPCTYVTPSTAATSWPFVLIDSGVRSSTMTMIKHAEPYFAGSNGEKRLLEFENVTIQVVNGLSSSDALGVADGMERAATMLQTAGVVTPALKNIMATCREVGVLAAKPTGAGGGGAILALLDQDQKTEQLKLLRNKLRPLKIYEVALP